MTNHSILLIDDEEIVRETVSDSLKQEGYQIITASDGIEGIRKFQTCPTDLVITDLLMRDVQGNEVFREVKKINPETPILILTGHATLDAAIEAFRLGANDFLVKPCEKEELNQRIIHCLEMKERQRKEKLDSLLLVLCRYCNKLKNEATLTSGGFEKEVWVDLKSYLLTRFHCEMSYKTCPECRSKNE